MKAVVCTRYGPPDLLRLEEVEKPSPGDGEILIRVRAASLNSWDVEILRGKPWLVRVGGLRRPMYRILGADVAGVVESVGRNVEGFRPGDEVFGDLCQCGWGGLAEYACADPASLAAKPPGLSFAEAAAIPQAGVMALQGIRQYGKVRAGHKVLVNGAGGGVGTFAVQMAKRAGAEVTGVDAAGKLDLLRSLGADHVIDYTREDFTRTGQRHDVILDVAVHRSMRAIRRALRPGGRHVMVGGALTRIFAAILLGRFVSRRARMVLLAHRPNQDLASIGGMAESGEIRPVIDQLYTLEEAREAFRRLGEGKARGKLVLTIG